MHTYVFEPQKKSKKSSHAYKADRKITCIGATVIAFVFILAYDYGLFFIEW